MAQASPPDCIHCLMMLSSSSPLLLGIFLWCGGAEFVHHYMHIGMPTWRGMAGGSCCRAMCAFAVALHRQADTCLLLRRSWWGMACLCWNA